MANRIELQKKLTIRGKTIFLDNQLYMFMQHFLKAIEQDWDLIFMVDGVERVGKTTFCASLGYYLSKGKFSLRNIVFTDEQFIWACENFEKEDTIMVDEAVFLFLGTEYAKKFSKAITKKLTTIGKKRLKIIIISPFFYMLTRYIAIARTKFLIHLKTPDFLHRGYFDLFPFSNKKKLFLKHKDSMSYPNKLAEISGRIKYDENTMNNIIDWEAYEKKKDEAISSIEMEKDLIVKTQEQRNVLIYEYVNLNKKKMQSCEYLAKHLGLSERTIYDIYLKIKDVKGRGGQPLTS